MQKCSNVFYTKHADTSGNLVYVHGDQIWYANISKYRQAQIKSLQNTIQKYRGLNFEDKGQGYIIPPEQKCSNVFYTKHADMSGNLVYDMVTRSGTLQIQNIARAQASLFKLPFRDTEV